MKNIKDRLVQLREDNNLSKIEMAQKIGVNKSTITRYESGEMKPTLDVMIEISKVFGVSLDWLAGFDVEEVKKYDHVIMECANAGIDPKKLSNFIETLKNMMK